MVRNSQPTFNDKINVLNGSFSREGGTPEPVRVAREQRGVPAEGLARKRQPLQLAQGAHQQHQRLHHLGLRHPQRSAAGAAAAQ